MIFKFEFAAAALLACALAGCGRPMLQGAPGAIPALQRPAKTSKIQHVVIVVQENRSFDNFFATYPGADGTKTGMTSKGPTPLVRQPLAGAIDIEHRHATFVTEYDGGKMDGFDRVSMGNPPVEAKLYPYQYVNPSDIAPYWTIAKKFVLADHMFQTQTSGSFTAHQDLVAGATRIAPGQSVVDIPTGVPWGCDAPRGTVTSLLTKTGVLPGQGPFPCFTYPTIRDTLEAAGLTWKYYAPKVARVGPGGYWNAFDAIKAVRYSSDWSQRVVMPETRFLTDAAKGNLPNVSWVIPDMYNSDHPGGSKKDDGPSWVASIVNAVGENPTLWNSTAIVIVWDDWGGFYDHVKPPQLDYNGLGFRVPCLIVSPYARTGYVDHTRYEFGSILRFIEDNWSLPTLGTTDARAAGFAAAFNFDKAPRRFTPIAAPLSRAYFEREKPSGEPVDDE